MNATIVSDAALERPPVAGPMPSSVPDVVGSGVVASTGAFIALLQMLIGSKGSVIDATRDAPTSPVASLQASLQTSAMLLQTNLLKYL